MGVDIKMRGVRSLRYLNGGGVVSAKAVKMTGWRMWLGEGWERIRKRKGLG